MPIPIRIHQQFASLVFLVNTQTTQKQAIHHQHHVFRALTAQQAMPIPTRIHHHRVHFAVQVNTALPRQHRALHAQKGSMIMTLLHRVLSVHPPHASLARPENIHQQQRPSAQIAPQALQIPTLMHQRHASNALRGNPQQQPQQRFAKVVL
jgi:hypothetical protein